MLWNRSGFNELRLVWDVSEYRVETVEQYLSTVDDACRILWDKSGCGPHAGYSPKLWFRGLRSYHYPLIPLIGRENLSVEQEESTLSKFSAEEKLYPGEISHKSQGTGAYWERLFQMHYCGFPTRLMTWTEDPLVALIFAIDPEASKEEKAWDACVWCLNPVKLNTAFTFHNYLPEGYIPNVQEKKVYEIFGPGRNPFWNKKPAAVYGPVSTPEIVLQSGTFTVFPYTVPLVDMKELLDSGQYLLKIVIAGESRMSMTEQLQRYGLTKAQLTPESESEDTLQEEL